MAVNADDSERQLVGQIFAGVLALFGILIAVIGILVSLYADTPDGGAEAYVLWALIIATILATVLSGVTAGCALARMGGQDVPLNSIQGMVYFILFLVTTCVVTAALGALHYL